MMVELALCDKANNSAMTWKQFLLFSLMVGRIKLDQPSRHSNVQMVCFDGEIKTWWQDDICYSDQYSDLRRQRCHSSNQSVNQKRFFKEISL